MKITIITLFPEMFHGVFDFGPVRIAREKKLVDIRFLNLADYAETPKDVDDYPYGGGAGMVIKPEPVKRSLLAAGDGFRVLTTPKGKPYTQEIANVLSKKEHLIIFCGRYKGIDERVRDLFDYEISIGDYVLSGGEIPAMVIVDSVVRLLPGATSDITSVLTDSYQSGILSEPQYTRPRVFEGKEVPGVLLSGNHREIERYRRKEALRVTLLRRPDLLFKVKLDKEDFELIVEILKEAQNEQRNEGD